MKVQIGLLALMMATQLGCKAQGLNTVMQTQSGSLSVNQAASANVRILDQSGSPVVGATVTGAWSGVVTGQSTGITAADGYANLVSQPSAQAGNFTLTVTNVAKAGMTYDPTKNKMSWASISK